MDKGRREYTHPAFIAAAEEEKSEKARLERLAQEKAEWRALEMQERRAGDAEAQGRWAEELLTYKELGLRRPRKPQPVSRCPTPECFAELQKTKKTGTVDHENDVDVEMGHESEVEDE